MRTALENQDLDKSLQIEVDDDVSNNGDERLDDNDQVGADPNDERDDTGKFDTNVSNKLDKDSNVGRSANSNDETEDSSDSL